MKIHQRNHTCQHHLQLPQTQPNYSQRAALSLLCILIQIMNQNHQQSIPPIFLFSFNIQSSSFSLFSSLYLRFFLFFNPKYCWLYPIKLYHQIIPKKSLFGCSKMNLKKQEFVQVKKQLSNSIIVADYIPFQKWLLPVDAHCLRLLHLTVLVQFELFASLFDSSSFLFIVFCFLAFTQIFIRRLIMLIRKSFWLPFFPILWCQFHSKIRKFGWVHSILMIWDLDYFRLQSITISHSMRVQMKYFQFVLKLSCS